MTKLSKRAEAALALMKGGAYWRRALESGFRGPKFCYGLRMPGAGKAAGYGFKTWAELEDAKLLTTRACPASSAWPTEWVLA